MSHEAIAFHSMTSRQTWMINNKSEMQFLPLSIASSIWGPR